MLPGFHIKPVAAALLLAVVATGPVLADTSIKEKVTVAPGRQITPQDEAVISSAAVKVLRQIFALALVAADQTFRDRFGRTSTGY